MALNVGNEKLVERSWSIGTKPCRARYREGLQEGAAAQCRDDRAPPLASNEAVIKNTFVRSGRPVGRASAILLLEGLRGQETWSGTTHLLKSPPLSGRQRSRPGCGTTSHMNVRTTPRVPPNRREPSLKKHSRYSKRPGTRRERAGLPPDVSRSESSTIMDKKNPELILRLINHYQKYNDPIDPQKYRTIEWSRKLYLTKNHTPFITEIIFKFWTNLFNYNCFWWTLSFINFCW